MPPILRLRRTCRVRGAAALRGQFLQKPVSCYRSSGSPQAKKQFLESIQLAANAHLVPRSVSLKRSQCCARSEWPDRGLQPQHQANVTKFGMWP